MNSFARFLRFCLLFVCMTALASQLVGCGGGESSDDPFALGDGESTNAVASAEMMDESDSGEDAEIADDSDDEAARTADDSEADQADTDAMEQADTDDAVADTDDSAADTSGGIKVLAVGDSITVGYLAESWASKLARYRGVEVVRNAANGAKASSLGSRVSSGISNHNPTHILILMGTNNANGNDLNVAGPLGAALDMAIASGAKTIVGTIPPLAGEAIGNAGNVSVVNGQITGAAGARGIRVANVNGAFANNASLLQADGVHPTDAGQNIIAASFGDSF